MPKTEGVKVTNESALALMDSRMREYYANPLNKQLSIKGYAIPTVLVSTGWHKDLGH